MNQKSEMKKIKAMNEIEEKNIEARSIPGPNIRGYKLWDDSELVSPIYNSNLMNKVLWTKLIYDPSGNFKKNLDGYRPYFNEAIYMDDLTDILYKMLPKELGETIRYKEYEINPETPGSYLARTIGMNVPGAMLGYRYKYPLVGSYPNDKGTYDEYLCEPQDRLFNAELLKYQQKLITLVKLYFDRAERIQTYLDETYNSESESSSHTEGNVMNESTGKTLNITDSESDSKTDYTSNNSSQGTSQSENNSTAESNSTGETNNLTSVTSTTNTDSQSNDLTKTKSDTNGTTSDTSSTNSSSNSTNSGFNYPEANILTPGSTNYISAESKVSESSNSNTKSDGTSKTNVVGESDSVSSSHTETDAQSTSTSKTDTKADSTSVGHITDEGQTTSNTDIVGDNINRTTGNVTANGNTESTSDTDNVYDTDNQSKSKGRNMDLITLSEKLTQLSETQEILQIIITALRSACASYVGSFSTSMYFDAGKSHGEYKDDWA